MYRQKTKHKMSTVANKQEINLDLAKERAKCNFDIEEVTNFLDNGKDKTLQRKKIEELTLSSGASIDSIPEECLDLKARYENAVRKSTLFAKIVKDELLGINAIEYYGSPILRRTTDAYFKDISPFLLHMGMFVTTVMGQSTPEQLAKWLPRSLTLEVIGAYAQTELGHGTFIRGLETTATYDPETEEFIIHSPTLTSYKWWAGGLGKTANHCIVLAQLHTQGKCYGIYPFIVQIRDVDTHMPLPGVHVGDVGPRMGYTTADNGFCGFKNYRIPRDNMLMKNAQVLKDGTFVKKATHGKLTYSTMVFVRVTLVNEAFFCLAKSVTIAVRYSAVRRQCEVKANEPELQILDYPTQQHKLFVYIATAHAFQLTANWLWKTFTDVLADMREGNLETLPELHALSSCLKAVCTSDAAIGVEQCRYACGGHGYMMSSNFPFIYGQAVAIRTYEGDYTVLMLQTARFLIKAWEQAEVGESITPTVAYLNHLLRNEKVQWNYSPECIIKSFQAVAAGKIGVCVKNIRDRVKSGNSFENAWQLTTVQLVEAAEAHCRAVIISTYWNEMLRLTATCSENVKIVLNQLTELYLIYWVLQRTGDLLRSSTLLEQEIENLQGKYEKLLEAIRPNAVGLVDAFDIRDEILQSSLGAYDGRVYERLMEQALKSPLNEEPVNDSFHKYMKPFRNGKL